MTANDARACRVHSLLPAGEDGGQDLQWQLVARERDNVERGDRHATHGVHIRERVRGRYLAERERVIDDRREKVHRLDEREIVGQQKDARVVERFAADQELRMRITRERRERAGEVTRTQFRSSASAARESRQAEYARGVTWSRGTGRGGGRAARVRHVT